MTSRQRLSALLVGIAVGAAACGASPDSAFEASAQARRFPIAGVVRAADKDVRQVTVAHEAIPGLMDAMTMTFAVREAWAASVAAAG